MAPQAGANNTFSSGQGGETKGGNFVKPDKQRKGTPGNNQDQNRQVRDIVRELGLTKDQKSTLHRIISKKNLGYQEIKELAQDVKEGFR